MRKKKRTPWFRPYHWIYLPNSWQGYLLTILIVIFNITVFQAIDRHSHSVSDTLYGIFPYVVPSFGMLLWIASESSNGKK